MQEMYYSIVLRGRRGQDTGTGSVFYIREGVVIKCRMCLRTIGDIVWLIIIFPTSPRLVIGARVNW